MLALHDLHYYTILGMDMLRDLGLELFLNNQHFFPPTKKYYVDTLGVSSLEDKQRPNPAGEVLNSLA
jgi:hypothetical protein